MSKVIIIGGGAAGMFCGIFAGQNGHEVTLIEQNEKLGKKLFITGKGRCNFTNNCTEEEFLANVVTNPKFLYSAIYGMNSQHVMNCFEEWGMRTKTERGRRAFPASDHAADVIDTLKKELRKNGVRVMLNTKAVNLKADGNRVTGVTIEEAGKKRVLACDSVIIATGGLSYPSTGSTGDGYRFAQHMGLTVTKTSPSLVPINCAEEYVKEMQGLSLKNVELHVKSGKKEIYDEFGEMMFTHFGVTGPLILTASAKIGTLIGQKPMETWIDLKPALTEDQLDARLLRIISESPNKSLKNVLGELYPSKMQPVIANLAGIDTDKRLHDITRNEREALIRVTKHFPLTFTALRGYNEAVVTKGGVAVKEIDAKSMRAKETENLYFIGEVLDLDAYTGGYNLQIAWATAYAAAMELEYV